MAVNFESLTPDEITQRIADLKAKACVMTWGEFSAAAEAWQVSGERRAIYDDVKALEWLLGGKAARSDAAPASSALPEDAKP